jgi:hypothetical protein
VVEIVRAMPEEEDALRVRQLAAIRRFLAAVGANRKAVGVSGLTGSVRRQTTTGRQTSKRAQGGAR